MDNQQHPVARRVLAVCLLAGLLLAVGCSPEAARSRSAGSGADVGNRGASVDMHGARNPYYRTPAIGQAVTKK